MLYALVAIEVFRKHNTLLLLLAETLLAKNGTTTQQQPAIALVMVELQLQPLQYQPLPQFTQLPIVCVPSSFT